MADLAAVSVTVHALRNDRIDTICISVVDALGMLVESILHTNCFRRGVHKITSSSNPKGVEGAEREVLLDVNGGVPTPERRVPRKLVKDVGSLTPFYQPHLINSSGYFRCLFASNTRCFMTPKRSPVADSGTCLRHDCDAVAICLYCACAHIKSSVLLPTPSIEHNKIAVHERT